MKKGYIFILDAVLAISVALIISTTIMHNLATTQESKITNLQLQTLGQDFLKILDKTGELEAINSKSDEKAEDDLSSIINENIPFNIGVHLSVLIYEYEDDEFDEEREIDISNADTGNEFVSVKRSFVINNGEMYGLAKIDVWFK